MEYCVYFKQSGLNSQIPPITVQFTPNMKISEIIQRYRIKANDYENGKFIFTAKVLNPQLTAAEVGLKNNSNIFVAKIRPLFPNNNISEINFSNTNEIYNLNSELNKLKQEIEIQNITIKNLNRELNIEKEIIKNKDYTINELKNQLNYKKEESDYNLDKSISIKEILQKKLKEKDFELQNLKNNNLNIKNEKFVKESQIAVINFSSSDQRVHYATSCLNSTIFAEIEEKLYKIYPEYRETNNTFIANGKTILRFKTVSENGIGNGFPVILYQPNNK